MDVIVIGMGAAGLFALANIPKEMEALGIEKNSKAGIKLSITGGGKAFIAPELPVKSLPERYSHPSFVRPIIYSLSPDSLRKRLENLGIDTVKTGSGIYPKSMSGKKFRDDLVNISKNNDHRILYGTEVVSVDADREHIEVHTDRGKFRTKRLIIAVGSIAYPRTGSDGKLVSSFFRADEISEYRPGLAPIYFKKTTDQRFFSPTAGVSLKKLGITMGDRTVVREAMFGNGFITGSAAFDQSAYIRTGEPFYISLLPEMKPDELRQYIANSRDGKQQLRTILSDKLPLPKSIVDLIFEMNGITNLKSADATTKQVDRLVQDFTKLKLICDYEADMNTAMAAAGGVRVDLLNNNDMTTKKDPRIMVIGEATEILGDCGGFNLLYAFASALRATEVFRE